MFPFEICIHVTLNRRAEYYPRGRILVLLGTIELQCCQPSRNVRDPHGDYWAWPNNSRLTDDTQYLTDVGTNSLFLISIDSS